MAAKSGNQRKWRSAAKWRGISQPLSALALRHRSAARLWQLAAREIMAWLANGGASSYRAASRGA